MHLPKYPLSSDDELYVFEFKSIGDKGTIHKIIRFSPTHLKGFYNLGFGDVNEKTGKISDSVVSDNGDIEKVLATVVSAVYAFTDKYPDNYVFASGSTESRTRLYRIGITKYLEFIENDFDLYGLVGINWKLFEKGVNYEGFLVRRKQ